MKKLAILIGLVAVIVIAAAESSAQSKIKVRFAKGKAAASYNGSIRGTKYVDYVLRAKKGQTLKIAISKNMGSPVYFNVLRWGSDVAISIEARQTRSFRGSLPEDGLFAVRVFMEKADRLRNRPASFRIGFSIE